MVAAQDRDWWLFGYGSLIWKVDFDYVERRRATCTGFARRFWQGSHDHRGTPDAPGRVVTLIEAPGETCVGMAFRIAAERTEETLDHLDFREKNGYQRLDLALQLDGQAEPVAGLVYVATPDNFAHLGPASDEAIANQIAASHGPSGANAEYLFELERALATLGVHEAHVTTLAALVRARGEC